MAHPLLLTNTMRTQGKRWVVFTDGSLSKRWQCVRSSQVQKSGDPEQAWHHHACIWHRRRIIGQAARTQQRAKMSTDWKRKKRSRGSRGYLLDNFCHLAQMANRSMYLRYIPVLYAVGSHDPPCRNLIAQQQPFCFSPSQSQYWPQHRQPHGSIYRTRDELPDWHVLNGGRPGQHL